MGNQLINCVIKSIVKFINEPCYVCHKYVLSNLSVFESHLCTTKLLLKSLDLLNGTKKMLSVLAIGLFPEANIYLALNYLASYTITTRYIPIV